MGIDIQQPLILANDQTIVFDQLVISNGQNNALMARVFFVVLDENNSIVDTFVVEVDSSGWNSFWQSLTSPQAAQAIYQLGLAKKNSNVSVPADIGNDFVNKNMDQANLKGG